MFTKGISKKTREIQLIAEVKTRSPYGYKAEKSWEELFNLANANGDILSIHTDPKWGGSMDLIKLARIKTERPILAKGIHATDDLVRQAHTAGADLILVVGRLPHFHNGLLKKCLIEPTSIKNMKEILAECNARGLEPRIVWNSRDLETGKLKTEKKSAGAENETWKEARKLYRGWMCQASNIKSIKDVHVDADAVIVGEHLERFIESL